MPILSRSCARIQVALPATGRRPNRTASRSAFLAALACAALTGCGASGPSGGPELAAQLAAFATSYAQAYCGWRQRCGGSGYGDVAQCRKVERSYMMSQEVPEMETSVGAGLQSYDTGAARACIDQLDSAGCDTFPDVCRHLTKPNVPLGGSCYSPADCRNGSCGPVDNYIPCPATCVPYAEHAGDSCASTGCDPAKGLHCDFWTLTCQPPTSPANQGESCSIDQPCADGLYCDTTGSGSPTCTESVPAGGSCANGEACAAGTVCVGSGADATCRKPSGVGGPCTVAGPTDAFDEGCELWLACVHGTCEPPPSSGPCGPDIRMECDAAHYCDETTKTCEPMLANGQPCTMSSACYGGTCKNGKCAMPSGCFPGATQ